MASETEIDRERERENEARNVTVTAPANLTALLFNASSEGQDSEIALCRHLICPRSET